MFEELDAHIVPEEIEMLRDEAVSEISIHLPSPNQVPSPATPLPTASLSVTPDSSSSRRSARVHKKTVIETPVITPVHHPKKKVPLKHIDFTWKSIKKFNFGVEVPVEQNYIINDTILTPLDYFTKIFSNEVIKLLVEQSNLFSIQKFSKPLSTTPEEMKNFLSIKL